MKRASKNIASLSICFSFGKETRVKSYHLSRKSKTDVIFQTDKGQVAPEVHAEFELRKSGSAAQLKKINIPDEIWFNSVKSSDIFALFYLVGKCSSPFFFQ